MTFDYTKPPPADLTHGLSVFGVVNGEPVKYWFLEVRYRRRLTRSEVRNLCDYLPVDVDGQSVIVGEDGVVSNHWPDDWCNAWTNVPLAQALKRLNIPCRVRAAPAGRDCAGRGVCDAVCLDPTCCPSPRCEVGGCGSCDPVFTEADWQHLDFHEVTP